MIVERRRIHIKYLQVRRDLAENQEPILAPWDAVADAQLAAVILLRPEGAAQALPSADDEGQGGYMSERERGDKRAE